MNRAVVVLLLLIAHAVVSARKAQPPDSAPPARTDYHSLGFFTVVDGAGVPVAPELDECPIERARRERSAAPAVFDDIRL